MCGHAHVCVFDNENMLRVHISLNADMQFFLSYLYQHARFKLE